MTFDSVFSLLLGGTIGFFYVLYVVIAPKDKNIVFQSLITLLTISLPLMVSKYFAGTETEVFLRQMTLGAILSVFLVLLLIYIFFHQKKLKQINNTGQRVMDFSFLNLLLEGYAAYNKKIHDEINITKAEQKQILNNLEIGKFIAKVYILREPYRKGNLVELENNRRAFAKHMMLLFLEDFVGKSIARFSFWECDPAVNSMKCTVTTEKRLRIPASIPLNKKNMFLHAMEKQKPLFYSDNDNRNFHFETNGAIKSGKYDDYVTYCIDSYNNTPRFCVCFDFKKEVDEKIRAFVQSGYFGCICDMLDFDMEA